MANKQEISGQKNIKKEKYSKFENEDVEILAVDELMKFYIPKYIDGCNINDDNTISLMELDNYLSSQDEILNWAITLPIVNDEVYGLIFDKMLDEDILKICTFLNKKYSIEVVDIEHLQQRDDIQDSMFENEYDLDSEIDINDYFSKKNKQTKEYYKTNTAMFCNDIGPHSEEMTPEEEIEVFKTWEIGTQIFLLGVAGVPALMDHILYTIENALPIDYDEETDKPSRRSKDIPEEYKGMKIVIKGLEEDSFSEEERNQIDELTQKASHSNINNIIKESEEKKFKEVVKDMLNIDLDDTNKYLNINDTNEDIIDLILNEENE